MTEDRLEIRTKKRLTFKEKLLIVLKRSYPYPPNPICSSNASVNTVDEALKEAGYKDYRLYVRREGIFIEPKKN
jgi:hypothetical protein